MNERWKQKDKPGSLESRFEFDSFEKLRSFLDQIAEESERLDHHANISFGREHVAVIIYAKTGTLGKSDFDLADGIDKSFQRVTQQP
ncbi:4a-hydroxytetrahydrobiopterin dehydratase [Thiomicrorhabdus cannonii]|uniref:4a-hydroxytetrahydrobiopterin dehydratase n=1 Tax=Thiomicrorhabdus cannonii TaxID=2748011 RepID=UPI0015C030BA|nr:4a-hydroxytetrahydrobiopterin dehydratase [Thiomicrorhabdus cannonii]